MENTESKVEKTDLTKPVIVGTKKSTTNEKKGVKFERQPKLKAFYRHKKSSTNRVAGMLTKKESMKGNASLTTRAAAVAASTTPSVRINPLILKALNK